MAKERVVLRGWLAAMVLPRDEQGHKYDFGHALLVCGSEAMSGAAVLAVGGALRSGCGLVTLHTPRTAAMPTQANHPSAMVSIDRGRCFSQLPSDLGRFAAIGCGCGLGSDAKSAAALSRLMQGGKAKMVFDADALNMIVEHGLITKLPDMSILTPHQGELQRLVGPWADETQMVALAQELASSSQCVVVVKGSPTRIIDPQGNIYINATGNPGMAKGGSGDVLTGLITGLAARGYDPLTAALLGVWLHGNAGDKAAAYYGLEAMNSGDLADFISEAFAELTK